MVFAVLAAAFAFLLVEGLGSSLDYFDTVNQALAHRGTLGTTTFRLEGTVVPGSIRSTSAGTDFTIGQGANTVAGGQHGQPARALPVQHPSGGGRALHHRHLARLRVQRDPGQALTQLHRQVPDPGEGQERDRALTDASLWGRSACGWPSRPAIAGAASVIATLVRQRWRGPAPTAGARRRRPG